MQRVMDRWSALRENTLCTSAICVAEVLQGLEDRGSDKYWRRYREILAGLYPVLAFDGNVAKVLGQLATALKRRGQPKPAMDLLIAATAKRHGCIVATLNARDFVGMPGVAVEDWSEA